MNIKKILLILGFVAVSVGIAFGLYYMFFRTAPSELVPAGNENVNGGGSGLPTAGQGQPTAGGGTNGPSVLPPTNVPAVSPVANGGLTTVTPVVAAPTVGAAITKSGQLNYYNRTDGKFYRLTPDGTVSELSNKVFFDVSNAKFDPKGNKAIIEYPDGANVMYDFATNQQATLPKHWEGFDFSPSGEQIVAKSVGTDPESRFLVTANPDGSSAHPFQELGENQDKVQVAWSPNNDILATATTGNKLDVDRQEVYLLGQYGQNFKSMIVEGLDFRPEWAPSGQQMVYSVAGHANDWKPGLWIVDAQGDDIGRNRRNLNVNTWADKCTFADDNTMYCGVPNDLPRGAGLDESITDGTPDSIYKIDLNTGLQSKVAIPEGTHTVQSMMMSPDKKTLYFTDKGTGVLNKISL